MTRVVRFSQYGGPQVLRIEDIDVAQPGPDEVRVSVRAIGLNRAESMFRSGQYLEQAEFPSRLGYEAAGVVESVGARAGQFAVGDVVSLIPPISIARWGTYAELYSYELAGLDDPALIELLQINNEFSLGVLARSDIGNRGLEPLFRHPVEVRGKEQLACTRLYFVGPQIPDPAFVKLSEIVGSGAVPSAETAILLREPVGENRLNIYVTSVGFKDDVVEPAQIVGDHVFGRSAPE